MRFEKISENERVEVKFDYNETCNHVYKHFSVTRNGKKSNIVGLRKHLSDPDNIPEIVTAKTYFWSSSNYASGRRSNERRRNQEVRTWLLSEGFEEVEYAH
jgi:hypothetical protein